MQQLDLPLYPPLPDWEELLELADLTQASDELIESITQAIINQREFEDSQGE